MSKLQAPDKKPTVRFTVDMSVGRTLQVVDVGGKDRAQESAYCADVIGGWVDRGKWVKVIVIARIKVVKKFTKYLKSCSGLVTQ
jgi:hypothetical protein